MKQAQKEGAHLLILDTENAIDIDFLERIGVKTDEEHLTYIQVGMIEDVNAVFSDFFAAYEKEHGNYNYQAPKVLAVIDSLAMLSTITETENYEKRGEIKGDQGQRAKRTKAMLRMILSRIAKFPITVIVTDHVYPQDVMLGDGPWAITNSTKFFPSIIGLISKLKLKEDSEVVGIRMRVEAYKTRFAMTGGKVELEVPYTSGMSPYSGLLELLEEDKVVSKAGAWYSCQLGDELIKFQKKQLDEELVKKLLSHPIVLEQEKLVANAMESISEPEIDEINQTEELSEQE
jgi:recombination protein RecA